MLLRKGPHGMNALAPGRNAAPLAASLLLPVLINSRNSWCHIAVVVAAVTAVDDHDGDDGER